MKVIRTDHGWPGHFIGGTRCYYHRNTHLHCGPRCIVISTVGNWHPASETGEMDTIGLERHYETMAFEGVREGIYLEANVRHHVGFRANWSLKKTEANADMIDNLADAMHEDVVNELSAMIRNGRWWKMMQKEWMKRDKEMQE